LSVASDGGALDYALEAHEVLAKALSAEEVAGLTQVVQNFDFDAFRRPLPGPAAAAI
jgi:hypothetical protein